MNIIDLQERLKDLPEQVLMQEMQMPTGTAPQFLVLGELKRRKRMRDDYQRMQASDMQTVAEEAITAAGMPQEGIMGLAQGMAPRSAIAQDTGVNDMMQQESVRAPQPEQPMMMADGGYVRRMQDGGFTDRLRRVQEEGYLAFLNIMNLQDSPESREMYAQYGQTSAASGGTMPDKTRARLDLISRMTDPDSSFMKQLDQFSAQLSDFGTQPQPMYEAPQGIASISADVSSFLPGMPGTDSRPTMMTAPPVLGAAPTADVIDFDASANPSVTSSRLSPTPSLPDAPLPSVGRARATNVGGRAFVLTEDGRVRDARTGAPASSEVEAEVRSRLSPQLNMMDVVGGVSQIDPTGGGVNPSFRENDGPLSPMPPDFAPMTVPTTPVNPTASFDMDAYQSDLAGVTAALLGPGLTAIDELPYDGPFFAPANDTSAAEAAVDRRMNADAVIDAPTVARTAPQSVSDVTRALEEFYPGSGYADVMRGGPRMPPDLSDKAGSGFPNLMDSLGNAAQLGTMLFPGARLPASEIIEAAPEIQDRLADPATADTQPVVDKSTPPGPPRPPSPPGGGGIASVARGAAADADKWLALAQFGLGLMSSQQPTLGGAIGEAGTAALGQLRESQKEAYERDLAERTLAARMAGSRDRDGLSPSNLISVRADLVEQLGTLTDRLRGTPTEADITAAKALQNQIAGLDRLLGLDAIGGLGAVSADSSTYRLPSATQ
jgi:hypothetical protein